MWKQTLKISPIIPNTTLTANTQNKINKINVIIFIYLHKFY